MNDTSAQDDGIPNSSALQNQNPTTNDQKRNSISQDNAGNLSVASLPGKGGAATAGEAENSNSNQSSVGEVKSNSAQSNVGSAGQIGSNTNANGQGSRKSINGNGNGSGSIGKLIPIQGQGQGSGQIQGQGQGSSQGTNGGQCMNVCLKQMPDGSYAIILPPSFVPPSQNLPQGQNQNQTQNQNQGNNINGCVPQNLFPQIGQNMLMNCGNIGGFSGQNPNLLGGFQDGTFDGTMGGFGMGLGPGGPLLGNMGLGGQDPILTMVNGQPCVVDPLTGQTIQIGPDGLILDGSNDPTGQFLGPGMGPLDLGQQGQFPLQFDFGPNGIGNGFIDQNGLNGVGPIDFGLNQGQGQGQGQGLGPSSKMPGNAGNGTGNATGPGFNTNGTGMGMGNQYQSTCDCQPLDCYLIPKGRGRDCKPRYELQCCNNISTPNPNANMNPNMNTNTACLSRDRRGPVQNPCSLSCTPTPRPQMQVPLPEEFNQPGQNEQRITLIREVYHFKKSPRSCSSKKPPCPCPCPCPYSHPCPCNNPEYKMENSTANANCNAPANAPTTARECLQCETNSITSCRPPWSNAFSYKPSCSRKRSVWPSAQKSSGCCSNSIGLLERDRESIFSSNPRSNSVCATPIAIKLQDSCNSKRGQCQGQGPGQCQQRQVTQQSQTQAQPQAEIQQPMQMQCQCQCQGQDPCPNPNSRKVNCRPIKTVDCGQVYLERQKGCKAPTSLVREFLVTGSGSGPDTKKYKAVVATVPPNCCFRTSNILEDGNSQVTCLPSDVQQALINCGLIGNFMGGPQSLNLNGLEGAIAQQNNASNRGSRSGSGPGNQNQNQGGRRSRNNSKSAGGLGNERERSMSGKINEIIPPNNAITMEQDMNNLNTDESMNFELDLNDTTNDNNTTTTTTTPKNDKIKTSTLAIMNKTNTNGNTNSNANANTSRKTSLIDSQPPKKKESLAGADVSKKKSTSRKNSMIQ